MYFRVFKKLIFVILQKLSLNPNVPEFVPSFKAVDPVHDPDDEAGTDGDDEAEIVDNQIVKAADKQSNSKDVNNWVEVKNKKQDRKSLPRDSAFETPERKASLSSKGRGGDDDAREELEFQFDEDLDMPTGRQNKFSAM